MGRRPAATSAARSEASSEGGSMTKAPRLTTLRPRVPMASQRLTPTPKVRAAVYTSPEWRALIANIHQAARPTLRRSTMPDPKPCRRSTRVRRSHRRAAGRRCAARSGQRHAALLAVSRSRASRARETECKAMVRGKGVILFRGLGEPSPHMELARDSRFCFDWLSKGNQTVKMGKILL